MKRVMLVDEEEDILNLGQISLQTFRKWDVVLASSGAEALKKAQTEKFDLIILDVMMSSMDGFETLRQLRQQPQNVDTNVLFITAANLSLDESKYHVLGAKGVVRKPFDPLTLPDTIDRILQSG